MYQRPSINKPEKPHSIFDSYGYLKQLSNHLDNGWESDFLKELHAEGKFALGQIGNVITMINSEDYSEYKPEVATKKKNDLIRKSRTILLDFLKRNIDTAKNNVEATKNKILRVTENEIVSDTNKNLERLFMQREIRDEIKATDPRNRDALIRGNIDYIKAVVASPTFLLSKEHLEELRIAMAYSIDPTLEIEWKDSRIQYRKVRERASEINATSILMLINSELDDPISPEEHFSVFVPETDEEKALANKRILSYNRKIAGEERKRQFEETHKGINLDVQRRKVHSAEETLKTAHK